MIGRPTADLETPVLLVDLDAFERNVARMRRVIIDEAGIGWRPHTKGIKTPAIAHKLLQAGALGVTCAKLSEAEVMAAAGIRDILIANQVVGAVEDRPAGPPGPPRRRHRGGGRRGAGRRPWTAAARDAGTRLRVVVEVNMAMNRAGVEPGEPVVALAKQRGAPAGVSASPG